MCLAGVRYSHLPFAIACANDKRAMLTFPVARLSGGLIGAQQFAAPQSRGRKSRARHPALGMRTGQGSAIAPWSGPSGTLSLWPSARRWLTRRFGRLATRRTVLGGVTFAVSPAIWPATARY